MISPGEETGAGTPKSPLVLNRLRRALEKPAGAPQPFRKSFPIWPGLRADLLSAWAARRDTCFCRRRFQWGPIRRAGILSGGVALAAA
jgi:hypothetical protein